MAERRINCYPVRFQLNEIANETGMLIHLKCVPNKTVIMSCQSLCCRCDVQKWTKKKKITIEYLHWWWGSENKIHKVVAFARSDTNTRITRRRKENNTEKKHSLSVKWSEVRETNVSLRWRIVQSILGINAIQSRFHTCDLARAWSEQKKTATQFDVRRWKKMCSARRSNESRMKLNISISSIRECCWCAHALSKTNGSYILHVPSYQSILLLCVFFSCLFRRPNSMYAFQAGKLQYTFHCPNDTLELRLMCYINVDALSSFMPFY